MKRLEFIQQFTKVQGDETKILNDLISAWHEGEDFSLKSGEIKPSLLEGLIVASKYFMYLYANESRGFRDKHSDRTFYKMLKDVILNNKTINYFGILCPSYKKGIGSIGFAGEPGNTTYRAFNNLEVMREFSTTLGIKSDLVMFFADISLENSEKFKRKDWVDLENIIHMDAIIAKAHDIPFNTLTGLDPSLEEVVGYKGKVVDPLTLDVTSKAIERSMWRDRKFYPEMFGWTIKQAEKRTLIHAHSYCMQAQSIREKLDYPVMVYSAYDYEKGGLYYGKTGDKTPCVIYPNKRLLEDHKASLQI